MLAALRAMDVDVDGASDAPRALEATRIERLSTLTEPVVVAWDGAGATTMVRIPEGRSAGWLRVDLQLEDGGALGFRVRAEDLRPVGRAEAGGEGVLLAELALPALPLGYHRLRLGLGRRRSEALVLSAPMRARPAPRGWGVFLPLYAFATRATWGIGDLTALGELLELVGGLGGDLVATLPLFAAFLDEPFDPSPYSPASRLFWNEIYLDVTAVPELERSAEARELVASRTFRSELRELRRGDLVDVRRVAGAKRRVLQRCAEALYRRPSARRIELERFAAADPRLDDYARFRAAMERHRTGWPAWPERERAGELDVGERDPTFRYHRYVQWLTQGQLDRTLGGTRSASLLLDLPLGVHHDGYDVWRERNAFAVSARAGAPPDALFSGGQDWGFPPLQPIRNREQGYRYPIACIRHLARHAGAMRIDHVMGLHRLYWIPEGVARSDGVYVHSPSEELYAILTLESERSGAAIVGEDLGTVPRYVRPAMARHGIHRAYVAQYELSEERAHALERVPPNALAAVNTHDMPTFAGFWSGKDIELQVSLGVTSAEAAERELARRERIRRPLVQFLRDRGHLGSDTGDPRAVLRGCLDYLATGPAAVVVANLEDLWLEPRPQNVPGTSSEHPNWRRRAALGLEEIAHSPEVREALAAIDRARSAT